jgi:prophage regulatory protein
MKQLIPANDNTPQIDPLLKLDAVKMATGLGRSTIYRMMDAGTFPRPLQLGPNSVRWRTSHVVEWTNRLEQQAA